MKKLNDVRVGVRLPLVPILALVALVVFALTAMTTLDTVRIGGARDQHLATDAEVLAAIAPPDAFLLEAELSAMEVLIAVLTIDGEALTEAIDGAEAQAAAFEETHARFQAELTDARQLEAMAEVRDTGLAYLEVLEQEFLPAARVYDTVGLQRIDLVLHPLYLAHVDAVERAVAAISEQTASDVAEAGDLVDTRTTLLWTLLVLTLLIVAAGAYVVTRSVLKPLDELRRNMDQIATGGGDTSSARLDDARGDEFGQVAAAFNTFADQLVASSAEVEANARIAEARAAEVAAAANVAAENMNTVAVATTELSAAASEIARSATDASRTADTAVRAADHANGLMERLADSSERIGEVVESIRGIAAQTTMLALNATIEAARAGEAGRGFAVVASEVKDLAAETGTATADIVSRVEAIHADTQAALIALGEVTQVITEISSTQSVIAAAVEEQAATTNEIDRSLTEAVTAVNQLASSEHAARFDRGLARTAVPTGDATFATVG
jgi:methyl-accepting chemotaxis protein